MSETTVSRSEQIALGLGPQAMRVLPYYVTFGEYGLADHEVYVLYVDDHQDYDDWQANVRRGRAELVKAGLLRKIERTALTKRKREADVFAIRSPEEARAVRAHCVARAAAWRS